MASYTFAHMEIAACRILVAAADYVGVSETSLTCPRILREEEEMARWPPDTLGTLTAGIWAGR